MIVQADEASLTRLLGVPAAQIPEKVLAEYQIRIKLFHRDGHSGPLGTLGLIDILRSMGLGRLDIDEKPAYVDWSRVPKDGSVRVIARVGADDGEEPEWPSGTYHGEVSSGKLAVMLDGDQWMHEFARADVRIAREEPMQPVSPERAVFSTIPIAEREPWASMPEGEVVMVKTGEGPNDFGEGNFQGVADDKILVVTGDDLTPREYPIEAVTCLEERLQKKRKVAAHAE